MGQDVQRVGMIDEPTRGREAAFWMMESLDAMATLLTRK